MPTKIIDNFSGRLTRASVGQMNTGLAKYNTTFGSNPFSTPENLTWLEAPIQIDPTGAVITDLIVATQPRLESGITYVYAIGHTGRLYKIQVNQPSGYNPNLDNPVLLTTLTQNSPTFKYGASILFFNGVMMIAGDQGVTHINFDGTGEAFLYSVTWETNVPRPSVLFGPYAYFGNGAQITAIDTDYNIYAAIAYPSFPGGTQVRDMTVNPEATYLQLTASDIPASDMSVSTQDTSSLSAGTSYRFLGLTGSAGGLGSGEIDITNATIFNSYLTNANVSFGPYTYTMGYDINGAAIYSGTKKILSLPNSISPNFNSLFSTGNLMGFGAPEIVNGYLQASIMFYGQFDAEVPAGLFRFLRMAATGTETDVIQMPVCQIVSNLYYGSSSAGYTNNEVGSAKMYFSTVETSAAPTLKYKFYKFTTVPTGTGTTIEGVYETQNQSSFPIFRQILSKKFKPSAIRFYTSPLIVNNSFQVDLIGSNGVMPNGTTIFTAGTAPVTVGQDYIWWTPQVTPTYMQGIRITNLGSTNWTLYKMEYDYEETGI